MIVKDVPCSKCDNITDCWEEPYYESGVFRVCEFCARYISGVFVESRRPKVEQ
jgi:hypothetical protein